MKVTLRYLTIWAACICAVVGFAGAQDSASASSGDIHVELNEGRLTLHARDAPLLEVIRNIGKLAGYKTILVKEFDEIELVNVTFDDMPVGKAVERLVSGVNRIVHYSPASNETDQPVITQVWLLGSRDIAQGGMIISDNQTFAAAHKQSVNDYKITRMARMLQEEPEAQVRARAATALGALGDEQAVDALQSALLLDGDADVRRQIIIALGQIGGEQATTILGDILLHSSVDASEELMAAQALRSIDSEAARAYLGDS